MCFCCYVGRMCLCKDAVFQANIGDFVYVCDFKGLRRCMCMYRQFQWENCGDNAFSKKYIKKKEQIQHEVNGLINSDWLPSFRSASNEIFQVVLPLDLWKIVESFLFNVEIRIYPLYPTPRLRVRVRVRVETHLGLDKALKYVRTFRRSSELSAYPVLNLACYWGGVFRFLSI